MRFQCQRNERFSDSASAWRSEAPLQNRARSRWAQPEGLSDSSRWSQRSADHRTTIESNSQPERVSEKRWHSSGVRTTWALLSGGLRSAATTGYYLIAFQAEIRSLGFHTGTHHRRHGEH